IETSLRALRALRVAFRACCFIGDSNATRRARRTRRTQFFACWCFTTGGRTWELFSFERFGSPQIPRFFELVGGESPCAERYRNFSSCPSCPSCCVLLPWLR